MADEKKIAELQAEESMFVQTAQSIAGGDGMVTLRGVSPSTLYFSDRPQRVVGHMKTTDFVDLWGAGDNSFETDPPNAVLSFLEAGGVPDDVVVVIRDPRLEDSASTYSIEVLEGAVPRRPVRPRCSSTPSAVRSRPSRSAAFGGANGGAAGARSRTGTFPACLTCVGRSDCDE